MVINDGSKDGTLAVLQREFGLEPFPQAMHERLQTQPVRAVYRSRLHPTLRVIDKENGGKADSLNAGINLARHELFCGVDADSILERDSLQKVVKPFLRDPRVVAVTAIDDCVRAVARMRPLRRPSQLTQLQFHCGKPPPAAEPRIWMYMATPAPSENENAPADRGVVPQADSATCEIHGHFKADSQISVSRFGPHGSTPSG